MDTQLKKGLLDICVLAVLKKSSSYGYQIIKDLPECIEISESTLYPILRRLEAANYLETYSLEHNNRVRKYYKITKAGEEHIEDFLGDWKDIMKIYHFIEGVQCVENVQSKVSE